MIQYSNKDQIDWPRIKLQNIYSQKLTFPGDGKPGNCPPNCEQTGASILFLENDINLLIISTMEVSTISNHKTQVNLPIVTCPTRLSSRAEKYKNALIFNLKAVSTFSITC